MDRSNAIYTICEYKKRFAAWFLSKINISPQMVAAAINATVSIIGTTITLTSQAPNHGCQNKNTRHHNNGNPYIHYHGMNAECSLSLVTIVIGIFILFVIAFGYFAKKCCNVANS